MADYPRSLVKPAGEVRLRTYVQTGTNIIEHEHLASKPLSVPFIKARYKGGCL